MYAKQHIWILVLSVSFFSLQTESAYACKSTCYTDITEALDQAETRDSCTLTNPVAKEIVHACDTGCANGCDTEDCDCTCCHGMPVASAVQQVEDPADMLPLIGYLSPYTSAYSFEYAHAIWQPPKV